MTTKAEKAVTSTVTETAEKTMKKQATSISYTMKATANNMKKLKELKLVTDEEFEKLKEIHKSAMMRWVGDKMF